jgi:phenylalanyl-tRNA synthetase alpha chain
MVDRIEEIEAAGREAVAGAGSAAELEEVRVTYLGRKADLTSILRGIADLDPAQRGPVGGAANRTR